MKDVAAAGAVVTIGGVVTEAATEASTDQVPEDKDRCPYFDQPMYCKGQSETGKPMCEEQHVGTFFFAMIADFRSVSDSINKY